MLKTILVPLDGSQPAERALSLATALSIPTGAHLLLVRVSTGKGASDDGAVSDTYLEKTAADLRERGFRVDTAELSGEPVARIIGEAARDYPADLISMATHGRTGPRRWVLGSVAEALVACSPVPILLQRAWDPGRRAILLGDQPKLLVTLDGSRFAEAVLPAAVALADDLGGEILLVRVDQRAYDILRPEEEEAIVPVDAQQYRPVGVIREYLDKLVARLRMQSGAPISYRIECGDPATAIRAAAEESQAALVMMATHGRTGFQRMALGSVADNVLQHGRAPLILVRPTPVPASTHAQAI
jgi:nucleotide-binding universal stress UspA family protein